MPTPPPVRLGVVGCGRVFERFHLPALRRTPSVALAAACDAEPARLGWTATVPGSPRRCATLDALLDGPVDGVLVLTPPATHAGLCMRALEAGCHVLVEKPMALTVADGAGMAAAARRAGRTLQVGFTRRFREPYHRLRAALAARGPASLRGADFELAFSTEGWGAHTDFLGDPGLGGGVLDDVLSHQVDLAGWLLGVPTAARAVIAPGADGAVEAELRIGGLAMRCRAAHGRYADRLTVDLADGRVLEATGNRMRVTGSAWRGWRRRRALVLDRAALVHDRLRRRPNVSRLSFERQLADFVARIRGEPAIGTTAEEALAGLRVLAACRESARRGGEWVPVG